MDNYYLQMEKDNFHISASLPDKALTDIVLNSIPDFLMIGDWYSYFTDLSDGRIGGASDKLCSIHGLRSVPRYFEQLVELIHPDDRQFAIAADKACYYKLLEIGIEYAERLKSAFSFRMLTKEGKYELFYYQYILTPDPQHKEGFRKLHMHCSLNHITNINSYKATVMGICGRNDFYEIDLSIHRLLEIIPFSLTKREKDIVRCLSDGMSSISIARKLLISYETVRVHRKNILRKTGTHNVGGLIALCSELGLL